MSTRLDIKKTYKLYIGGKFPRSESGRYLPATSARGEHLDNFAHASRKDFRDAVVAARAAEAGWGKATAYNRGQILYRAAEMLQNRSAELVAEIARSTGVSAAKARREVTLAIDRLVHFAGWTDKYQQVFGSVNPVASSHFDFTTPNCISSNDYARQSAQAANFSADPDGQVKLWTAAIFSAPAIFSAGNRTLVFLAIIAIKMRLEFSPSGPCFSSTFWLSFLRVFQAFLPSAISDHS